MSWIALNLSEYLSEMIGGFIDMLGDFLNNIFYSIVELATTNVYIINGQKFIVGTALSLITLMVIKIVISGYLLETDYDSEEDPFNLLVKIVETTAVITNAGWVFEFLLIAAKDFSADLSGIVDTGGYCGKTKSLLRVDLISMGGKSCAWVLILVIILIVMIIFTVVAGLRGAELVAMNLFMPFFALDLMTNTRERWNNFFSAYVLAFFTYAFQILFFMVALKCYMTVSITETGYFIPTLIWMIMAVKTPNFLEKYLYKSGISNASSGGLRMVAQNAAMRGMMKR